MSYIHYPNRPSIPRAERFRGIFFFALAIVLFLTAHSLADFPRSIGNYNKPQEDIVENVEGGNFVREIALLVLGAAAALSFASYKSDIRLHPDAATSRFLMAFVSWSALSLLWADDFMLALKRLAAFAILCIVSFAIVRMFSITEIVKWSFVTTATFLIIALAGELVAGSFHPWLAEYRFAGMLHPNAEGIECGLLCLSAIAVSKTKLRRHWTYLFAAMGFVFLLLTGSRTALIATVLSLGVYFLLSGSQAKKKLLLSSLAIIFILLAVLSTGLLPVFKGALVLERDGDSGLDSFAGRTEIWRDVSGFILEKPLVGHGYSAFWTPTHITEISDLEQWGVPDSHSVYVDYLLTLGAIGLILYLLCLGSGIKKSIELSRTESSNEAAFGAAVLVFGLIDGLFESSIGEGSLLMVLCMIVLIWIGFASLGELAKPALDPGTSTGPRKVAHA
jgi:exopolysaccharide production protein ExoQ